MSSRPSASAPVFSPRHPGTSSAGGGASASSPPSGTPLSGHAQAFQPTAPISGSSLSRITPALAALSLDSQQQHQHQSQAPPSPHLVQAPPSSLARAAKAAVFVPRSAAATPPVQSSPHFGPVGDPPNPPLPPPPPPGIGSVRAAPFHPSVPPPGPPSRPATPHRTPYPYISDDWSPPEYADPMGGGPGLSTGPPGGVPLTAAGAGPMYPAYSSSAQAHAASHTAALTAAANRMGMPPTLAQQQPTLALQYHLYAPAGPQPRLAANASGATSDTAAAQAASDVFFLPPHLNEALRRRQEATWTGPVPPALHGPRLPELVHKYHSLCPLERLAGPVESPVHAQALSAQMTGLPTALTPPDPNATPVPRGGVESSVYQYPTTVYKALCQDDGRTYCLTRLANFRLARDADLASVARWRNALVNPRKPPIPGVVGVYEAFTTRAWGDSSLVFVTEYHACSLTLSQAHLGPRPPPAGDAYRPYAQAAHNRAHAQPYSRPPPPPPTSARLPERTLWVYLVQLATALRAVHTAGLAVRTISPSKVLLTEPGKVRLNGASVLDVLDPVELPLAGAASGADHPNQAQRQDLVLLGQLILILAAGHADAVQRPDDYPAALAMLRGTYSAELEELVRYILTDQTTSSSELVMRLAPHLADTLSIALNTSDVLQTNLQKEVENGRVARLLCKLNWITERGEAEHDPRWSETGERYLVKLFRDLVFHASTPSSVALIDLSYVLVHLNKLDAGSEERLLLTSRDEQTCIVVSYHEIKQAIDTSIRELAQQ